MRITTVSPTRLKTALKCDFKYFLTYQWGWADELFQYTFASDFGTAVHNTLEEYANAKGNLDYIEEYNKQILNHKPFSEDMNSAPSKARASYFIEKDCASCPFFNPDKARCKIMDQHVEHFDGCPKKLYEDGLAMIETAIKRYGEYFNTGIKSKDNPEGRVLGVEAHANVVWGQDDDGEDIVMNGFIDLVVEYDEETVMVVDYKTGYSTPTHEDFLEDLQPRMYSYAAKQLYPNYKYHWVQFDYFRGIPMEHAFTDEDDEITRQKVVSLYNRIKKARRIKRRAYDHYCKYLCNRDLCNQKWAELLKGEDGSNPAKAKKESDDGGSES